MAKEKSTTGQKCGEAGSSDPAEGQKMDRRKFTRMMGMGSVALALLPSMSLKAGGRYFGARPAAPLDLKAVFTATLEKLPHAARPWVYWMWIGDNITAKGITADLEAMQRIGIGGQS